MSKDNKDRECESNWGATFAVWVMRLWLSMRAIVAGIEKYASTSDGSQSIKIDGASNSYGLTDSVMHKVYDLDAYQGVPGRLYEKFQDQPLIPETMLKFYDWMLGPALIVLGTLLLFGIATRLSLFAMGLLYVSLTFGMILIGQDSGIAWLGVHVILIVLMLLHVEHNKLSVLKKL